MTAIEKLAEYLRSGFNTELKVVPYKKAKDALVSENLPDGTRIIGSNNYIDFAGKGLETSISEDTDPGGIASFYFLFGRDGSGIAAQIAEIYPEKRPFFHKTLITAIVNHAMGIGSYARQNRILFPESLVSNLTENCLDHLDIGLEKYRAQTFSTPVIVDFNALSAREMAAVAESLKLRAEKS